MIVYIAVAPREMVKVKAEIVTVSFAGLTLAVQLYVIFSMCYSFPYAIRPLVVVDAFCGVCWCASIAVLAYWDRRVVYMPRDGDPDWWFACANAAKWEDTVTITSGGDYVHYINIIWCEVDVNGHHRLIGNGRAREQLHVMIAISTVALFLAGAIILWTLRRGKALGLIGDDEEDIEGRGGAGRYTSSSWSR